MSRSPFRLALAAALVGGLLLSSPADAGAAPPPNDSPASPLPIVALPAAVTVDTTEATVEDAESTLVSTCSAVAVVERTVWFEYVPAPGETGDLLVSATQRSFSASVVVAAGDDDGSLTPLACAGREVTVPLGGATRLLIGVFGDGVGCGTDGCGPDGPTTGGTVTVTVERPGPPPANDTVAGAVRIPSLPFNAVQDSSAATVDATEAVAVDGCRDSGAPTIRRTVWYRLDVPKKFRGGVVVDIDGSVPGAGFAVVFEGRDGQRLVRCQPTAGYLTSGRPAAGTYYIGLFTTEERGTVQLTVTAVPFTSPQLSVTVERRGTLSADGSALLRGTATCRGGAPLSGGGAAVILYVQPNVSGATVVTGVDVPMACDGTAVPWRATATPAADVPPEEAARFAAGDVSVDAILFGCDDLGCELGSGSTTVRLKRERR